LLIIGVVTTGLVTITVFDGLNYYVHCKSLLKVHFLFETVVLSDFLVR